MVNNALEFVNNLAQMVKKISSIADLEPDKNKITREPTEAESY